MTQITASMVKELRDSTGAGMMDAKKALTENNGDIEAAKDWLRQKGLAKAAKKSGRTAAEGLVVMAVSDDKKTGTLVEINSETDFVARNEKFQTFAQSVATTALSVDGSVDALAAADLGGKDIATTLTDMIATIGENMSLRRFTKLSVNNGAIATYVHNQIADNMGGIGVLVALESDGDQAKLQELGRKVAMHVAAAKPEFLSRDQVDAETLERERAVLIAQAKEEGKPEEIAQKMVEGRMRKYYGEVCLLEQVFVMDGETTISDVLKNAAGDVGGSVELTDYAVFRLGEGIEKEETDFAAEVAATAKTA